MNKLVVDSSIIIKWFVTEPYSSDAHRVLQEFQAGQVDLLAPDLIYAEIGNIIWKKQQFQGLSVSDAQLILTTFLKVPFIITPAVSLLTDAYQIAATHQRTVYDSLYLALSVREGCEFVTADEKLVNSVSNSLSNAIWIPNWKIKS